ncbi:MAG: hypothetical protein AAF928_17565 [Myxococcota bacterium]
MRGRAFGGFGVALVVGFVSLAPASCSSDPAAEDEPLCVAGDNIFCRCRGGAAGTKLCLDDGASFGACETVRGPCSEALPDGGDDDGGGTGGSVLPGGGDEPPPQPGELLAACTRDDDCVSGHCPQGFCSQGCDDYQQCAPPEPAAPGDCVALPEVTLDGQPGVCVPYCLEQAGCAAFGADSRCSYTEASFPAFGVVVCANWGDALTLPPDGYPEEGFVCSDDVICNLGLDGTERICIDGDCGAGCNDGPDCPDGVDCSPSGVCGANPSDGDDCPGVAIALPSLGSSEVVNGNTGALSPPAEHTGTGSCGALTADAEEAVYAVTAGVAGNLIVLVEPGAAYDAVVYVRQGSCAGGGGQVACADDGPDGGDEILETPLLAGETVYVVIDGFDGSAGPYVATFDLDQ